MTGRGVTYARGFTAGAAMAGVKHGVRERLDVALIASDRACTSAGVFTRSKAIAAPCVVSRRHLERGGVRAIVANSGNANACTGTEGERAALAMADAAARRLGCDASEVAVASTGVIGIPLPVERVLGGIAEIELSEAGWDAASRAIMTTDTGPKVVEREVTVAGNAFRIGGIAKGAGMIHPDMATLLAFITTDAAVDARVLEDALRAAVAASFNTISVDGDTSTNDTVLVLANGAAGLRVDGAAVPAFREALRAVCEELALAILSDGEGVTKVFRVSVAGARTPADAALAARTITNSNLVRTAVHGADPNYGRLIAAAARSGADMRVERTTVRIGETVLFADGAPVPFDAAAVRAQLSQPRIEISLDLGAGDATGVAWGADLSAEYVRINADYTT